MRGTRSKYLSAQLIVFPAQVHGAPQSDRQINPVVTEIVTMKKSNVFPIIFVMYAIRFVN